MGNTFECEQGGSLLYLNPSSLAAINTPLLSVVLSYSQPTWSATSNTCKLPQIRFIAFPKYGKQVFPMGRYMSGWTCTKNLEHGFGVETVEGAAHPFASRYQHQYTNPNHSYLVSVEMLVITKNYFNETPINTWFVRIMYLEITNWTTFWLQQASQQDLQYEKLGLWIKADIGMQRGELYPLQFDPQWQRSHIQKPIYEFEFAK